MRFAVYAVSLLLLVATAPGCSSSSAAQGPPVVNASIPVGVVIDFSYLSKTILLLNTQTDSLSGSSEDVWVHDISAGTNSLLMADAKSLLRDDGRNIWKGKTFLATPADTSSNNCVIWITDGTIAGTQQVIDLSSDPSISFQLRDVRLVGGRLVINVSEFEIATSTGIPRLVIVDLDQLDL